MTSRELVLGIAIAAVAIPFGAWLLAGGIADIARRRNSPERAQELERVEAWAAKWSKFSIPTTRRTNK